MKMKVDYEKIAQTYDSGRSYSERKLNFWLGILKRYVKLQPHTKVLDIGCGTGRFSIPLAERCSCRVAGIDLSKKMLDAAKEKSKNNWCEWIRATAEILPFAENTFDISLISMVIHHISNKENALSETYRVLQPEGTCIIRTCSHEQLKRLPDNYFFPEALKIDIVRIPDVPILETILSGVGFSRVKIHEVLSPSFESAEEYLTKIRLKHSSTFYLLSDADFNKGLMKAEKYFSNKPLPEAWKTEPISVIVATKSSH